MDTKSSKKHRDEQGPEKYETLWSVAVSVTPMQLPDQAPVAAIRDSLYDFIPLGAVEHALINSKQFLRLQNIKQLGFVYRIWPGATHTRYEHSIGVYYLALRAIRSLLHGQKFGGVSKASSEDLQTLLTAALLHDIGHYPFSHAIEELGHPIEPHEKVGRKIITESEIADILRKHLLSPERIANLIDPPKSGLKGIDALMVGLISGALDVDKLDYLPRDARACNVPYGGVDVTRLLGSLRVTPNILGKQRIVVTQKGVSPLNSLIHARQEMFDNIYWHHANRAQIVMLLRAVQETLVEQKISPQELVGHDDASFLALLSKDIMPESTRTLIGRLQDRQIYKTALEVSVRAGKIYRQIDALFWDQAKRRKVEISLAKALSEKLGIVIEPYDILIDIPKPEKWEMDVWVSSEKPALGMEPIMHWADVTGMQPDDMAKYEAHQRRIRIVVAEHVREKVQTVITEVLTPALSSLPEL